MVAGIALVDYWPPFSCNVHANLSGVITAARDCCHQYLRYLASAAASASRHLVSRWSRTGTAQLAATAAATGQPEPIIGAIPSGTLILRTFDTD